MDWAKIDPCQNDASTSLDQRSNVNVNVGEIGQISVFH